MEARGMLILDDMHSDFLCKVKRIEEFMAMSEAYYEQSDECIHVLGILDMLVKDMKENEQENYGRMLECVGNDNPGTSDLTS